MFHKEITVFAFLIAAGMFARGCELNQAQIQKDGMECVAAHTDPAFMMAIAEHMGGNTNDLMKPAFLCRYQKEIVNIFMCMKDKLQGCMPPEYKAIMELMPSKARMLDGMKFMCDHKEMMENKCLDNHMEGFVQCYTSKITQLQSTVTTASDHKGLFCSVIRSEEQCLRQNKGTCSDEFIDFMIQVIEKFFPMSSCSNAMVKTDLANTVLGSILVHGQPQSSLKFKPGMYRPYVIKN